MSAFADPVDDLLRYIEASKTPYHAVRETAQRLERAGFIRFDEVERWQSLEPGSRGYVVRSETSICAFVVGGAPPSRTGFRIVGSHTDSPNLRVKPNPQLVRSGYHQLGVEIYGGVLFSTWLDRDLSIAGRVVVQRAPNQLESYLIDFERAVMRIPNLAIHLNRMVNLEGLILNPQLHMTPVTGLELEDAVDLRQRVVELLARDGIETSPRDIIDRRLAPRRRG